MKPVKLRNTGYIRCRKTGGRYEARWTQPDGRDAKRVLKATSDAEALAMCKALNEQLLSDRGLIRNNRRMDVMPVSEGLSEAIRAMRLGELSVARNTRGAAQFQAYLAEHHPEVRKWSEIRPSMVAGWVAQMQSDGLAYDTIRLNVYPIRRASAFWAAEHPALYRDFVKDASLRIKRPETQREIAVLEPAAQMALIRALMGLGSTQGAIAVLSTMMGLRVLETAYIRHRDIDWSARTLTVAKSEMHPKLKTPPSARTIPMPEMVCNVLRMHLATQRVQDVDGYVFLSSKGQPYTFHGICGLWRDSLRTLRKDAEMRDMLAGFQPKHCRRFFMTTCARCGVDSRLMERYVGHAPATMAGQHYVAITLDDLRKGVVDKVERWMEQENESKEAANG